MRKPIKMPFWMWSRVGPRNRVLGGGPDPPRLPREEAILRAPLRCAVSSKLFNQLFPLAARCNLSMVNNELLKSTVEY